MIVYFDRYFYKSTSASALLLKRRIDLDKKIHNGNYVVFSTTLNYKNSVVENEELNDKRFITNYFWNFTSMFKLYVGFYLYYFKNSKKIKKIISQSSPGLNLFFFAFSPFRKKVTFIIQDVYPDGILKTLGFNFLTKALRPFFKFTYSRIDEFETISKDMFNYLNTNYNINPKINYNPNVYSDKLERKILNKSKIVFGYSGNFSNSHGYKIPFKLIEVLDNMLNVEVNIRGFGKYFDTCKVHFSNSNVLFGGGMNKQDYLNYLQSLDVVLLFQEWDYEKYCLSCKFNTTIELNKPIIYVGPECDISRYIIKNKLGLSLTNHKDFFSIKTEIDLFINEIDSYIDKARNNKQFDLNQFFNEYYLSNK